MYDLYIGGVSFFALAYSSFKLVSLNQFLSANIQNKGTIGRLQQLINFIDPYIVVFGCFSDCQRCL